MSSPVLVTDVESIELTDKLEPLNPAWVIDGQPVSRSTTLSTSKDRTSNVVFWECTPGCFTWHYDRDEVIFVLSGEAFLAQPDGRERRIGAGDLGFFSAGSSCTWRVVEHVRKVAVLRETMSMPMGYALKAWNKLCSSLSSPFSQAPVPAHVARTTANHSGAVRALPLQDANTIPQEEHEEDVVLVSSR